MKKLGVMLMATALVVMLSVTVQAGTMVEARCECGYQSGAMLLFGGRANFTTVCMFPAYCAGVKQVFTVNMYQNPPANPLCHGAAPMPYDHPSLIGEVGKGIVASWNTERKLGRTLVLTNGAYLCPACGQKRMRFFPAGMWD